MADELKTIATFQDPVAAHLAKSRLDAAGIPSCLMGETAVATTWIYANLFGGIQLQVAASDVARAEASLAETVSPEAVEEAALEAMEADADEDEGETAEAPVEARRPVATSQREQQAELALRMAIFGLLLFPLQFYTIYIVVKVARLDGPLRGRYLRRALIAAVLALLTIFFLLFRITYVPI